jgi:adenylate cyclase
LGDHATALARAEQAVRLSPLGPDAYYHEHGLSQALYFLGRFDEAAAWGQLSEAHCGAHAPNLRCLIACLAAAGNLEEARAAGRKLLQVEPGFGLAKFRARTPLSGEARDRFVEHLRSAGLPD